MNLLSQSGKNLVIFSILTIYHNQYRLSVLIAAQNGLLTFQALFRLSLDLPSYKY
jgi:hypothetical protein